MAPPSKSKKAKAKASAPLPGNMFDILEGKTGNPSTPKEFDLSNPQEGEVYFKAAEDADEAAKKRVFILNFIHQDLRHDIERMIPALTGEESERDMEIYHRATYLGQEVDVCVFFGQRDESGHKVCLALAKLSADGIDNDTQYIYADAAWTGHAKSDNFGAKLSKMEKNYWAPRWKYLVNILRGEMAERYSIEGVYTAPPVEVKKDEDENNGVSSSGEMVEEQVEVFAGCTGKIIGPKGAVINGIRSDSGCKNIEMPKRAEEGEERPKARSLVTIKVSGTARQNAKAKEMILAVQKEWTNAPRAPRDGGGDGGGSFHDRAAFYEKPGDSGAGGDTGGGNFGGGGTADWENAPAAGGAAGEDSLGAVATVDTSAPAGETW